MVKKLIYKIISYLIVMAIFYYLAILLIDNWQKIKEYNFSFNYFYLILSCLLLGFGWIGGCIIWNRILRIVDPKHKISYLMAIKIFAYSWFGRYLPGKVWMFLGRFYFLTKEQISKKASAISMIYEIILSITAGFIFSIFLLGIAFGLQLNKSMYLFSLFVIGGGLIFAHPKVLYPITKILAKRFNKIEISPEIFLPYRTTLFIILNYFVIFTIEGIAFFLLIKSLVSVPFNYLPGVIGAYLFSAILGTVVIFAPGGIGIKEGILTIILQLYLPLPISVLISLVSRVWSSTVEIVIFGFIYILSKFFMKEKKY